MSSPPPSPGSSGSFLRKLIAYAHLVGYLLRDLSIHCRWTMVAVLGLSVVGVSARGGIVGSVVGYVRAQTSGKPPVLLGFTPSLENPLALLFLCGGVALLLSLLTGGITWLSFRLVLKASQGYLEQKVRDSIAVFSTGIPVRLPSHLGEEPELMIRQVLGGDAMRLFRLVLTLLSLPLPVLTFIIATGVLFYLNPVLTLGVAAAFAFFLVPFYRLNLGLVRDSRRWQDVIPGATESVARVVSSVVEVHHPETHRPSLGDAYFHPDRMGARMDLFRKILFARRQVDMLWDVFHGVSLVLALIIFGVFMAKDSNSWAPFLTYVLALRYAVNGLGAPAKAITMVNRFLPEVSRFIEFQRLNVPAEATSQGPHSEQEILLTLQVDGEKLEGSLDRLSLESGHHGYFCVSASPWKAFSLWKLLLLLTADEEVTARAFREVVLRGRSPRFPLLSLRELLGGEAGGEPLEEEVGPWFEAFGLEDEVAELAEGLDTVLSSELEESFTPLFQVVLSLLPALRSERRLFLIDWEGLRTLSEAEKEKLLFALSDRVVVLLSTQRPKQLPAGVEYAIVLGETGLLGLGDAAWYERVLRSGQLDAALGEVDTKWTRASGEFEDEDLTEA